MKILNGYIFRAMCSILLGFLFIVKSDHMDQFLMMLIGGLFTLSGISSLIYYIVARCSKKSLVKPTFPFIAIANIFMGAALGFYAEEFANILLGPLVIILGILLAIAGLTQLVSMFNYRKVAPLGIVVIIMPILLLAAGLFLIFHPMDSVAITFQILGVTCIYYGISDLFLAIRLRHYGSQRQKSDISAANHVSETVDESEYVDFEVINSQEEKE